MRIEEGLQIFLILRRRSIRIQGGRQGGMGVRAYYCNTPKNYLAKILGLTPTPYKFFAEIIDIKGLTKERDNMSHKIN